jgi:alkanesulfonate monooxygenase SsuD/methylene tetrahydromethanopterin reductase-like flavin-dependent oxidoreductase (luciferase family)
MTVGGIGSFLERMTAVATVAESAGFTALLVAEPPPGAAICEPYSLLGALSVATSRLHLGVLPRGVDRRAPSIVAKIVTAVDVISHGRALLVVGSDARTAAASRGHLREALLVTAGVMNGTDTTFDGTYFSIHGAINRPAPVQIEGVPMLAVVDCAAGAQAESKGLLDESAGIADGLIVTGGAVGVAAARKAAEDAGRPELPVLVVTEPGATSGLGSDGVLIRWAGGDPREIADLLPAD